MEEEMLVISKEQVYSLIRRLETSDRIDSCSDEIRRMIDITSTLCWRADAGSCCVGWELTGCLDSEVHILEAALQAIVEGNTTKGIALLDDYTQLIDIESRRR